MGTALAAALPDAAGFADAAADAAGLMKAAALAGTALDAGAAAPPQALSRRLMAATVSEAFVIPSGARNPRPRPDASLRSA